MKTAFLSLVLTLAGMVAHAQDKVATVSINSSIYCDHCKECPSCGKRFETAVFSVKGVKRLDINDKERTLKVVYNTQKTSLDAIKLAITKVGFDADDMKADAAAYLKLDDCCKKAE